MEEEGKREGWSLCPSFSVSQSSSLVVIIILFLLLLKLLECFFNYVNCIGAANEVCDKLAVVGFNANMISYLTTQLHMPLTKAANTVTNFGGTAALTPLLGAFVADAYAGRFWTITVASIIYVVVSLTALCSVHTCLQTKLEK